MPSWEDDRRSALPPQVVNYGPFSSSCLAVSSLSSNHKEIEIKDRIGTEGAPNVISEGSEIELEDVRG